MTDRAEWVLADASTVGIVRFATAVPGASQIGSVVTLAIDQHPTFTDALLTFERQSGVTLRGAECVLAVAAPPAGDAIPVARTRWTISRSGLNQMFGRDVAVINDVAATAWSLLGEGPRLESFGGPPLDFARPGRWAIVMIDDGVNAAALDVGKDGRCHVIDGESGNAGFSPCDDSEVALMRTLRRRTVHVSWELALNTPGVGQHASAAESEAWSRMAGTFAGDSMLQLGAWSGVIITGRHSRILREPRNQMEFVRRMQEKSRYGRFIAASSRAFLATREPLTGGLALLSARRTPHAN